MFRLLAHRALFALLTGVAFLATNCGGGDDDADGPKGGGGGATNSGGRSGSAGKGGAAGRAGSNGDGGDGADSSSGGAGDSAGGSDSAGSGTQAGGAGQGGSANEPIVLTVADSASELIEADEGGTVTLGALTLEIPPDALQEDTEITIRSFEGAPGVFVFEPDGLEFEAPVTVRFTAPVDSFEGADEPGAVAVFMFETAPLDEPLAPLDTTSARIDEDENYVIEGKIEHFSAIWLSFNAWPGVEKNAFFTVEDLTVSPAFVPVGVQFGAVGQLTAKEDPEPFELHAYAYDPQGHDSGSVEPLHAVPVAINVIGNEALGLGVAYAVPFERIIDFDAPLPAEPGEPVLLSRQFNCSRGGVAQALMAARYVLTVDATASGYVVHRSSEGRYEVVQGVAGSSRVELVSAIRLTTLDVTCLDAPSTLTSLGAPSRIDQLIGSFKAAWQASCFWRSDHGACQSPNPALAIVNVLDPVLEVGPNAAARLEAAFPCGDGPVGRTFCGTPGTFAEGDYVFVLATLGDDIALDDDTSYFQHAFVFDADGDPENNYIPPAAYPDDFFGGTDKWYQLFYDPDAGFSMKVVDTRISDTNPVASNARMVIAGRELSAFIPRAELDGAEPGFRVSTFRHEGDYGLQGGPWDASYYPPLGEPLMPAARGETIVLPEE